MTCFIVLWGGMPLLGGNSPERPRLVVGIVIDQMRWDYLYRYQDRYTKTGFNRMLREGFSCENTMVNYIPTYTAIGHSSIYTGSVPSIHGIAGNNFIVQATGKSLYCTEDDEVRSIGTPRDDAAVGKMSPRNLKASTITDELELATNFRAKVIGVSLKDRGSILPAGHAADAAYWFDGKSGNWITSSWYRESLPGWLEGYNQTRPAERYLSEDWNTLYPIETYVQSTPDDNVYEEPYEGDKHPAFPIKTSELVKSQGLDLIRSTPCGMTMTFDVARLAIENERLGGGEVTDFLAVSLSSPDYVGHQFGANSVKVEDTYLRLDKELGDFLAYLDKQVGKGNYLVFLTADHAGAHNGQFLLDHKIPAGNWKEGEIRTALNKHLQERFGKEKLVSSLSNYQVHFNYKQVDETVDMESLRAATIAYLQQVEGVAYAVEMAKAAAAPVPAIIRERIVNGYNHALSGEIQVILKPAWYSDRNLQGATHGTWNPYDSHIPLLWMGWKIPRGQSNEEVYMTDIAPTLAALLRVQMPNGCVGKPITDMLKNVKREGKK
ncbi:MAG: alkaline phosphatase family protein [Odoribacteraceae bacterium]|nr:alkaline phosphatase family protein [Odoribacteraceae bacterium]